MKVLISSGSRGEWGYYKPVIKELVNCGIDYEIMTMNMAAVYEYGNLHEMLIDEGYKVKFNIISSYHGDNHYSMSKMFSSLSSSFADILANNEFDWVLIAGDRIEQLAVATICNIQYVPCAHIQAGEMSGNIDGVNRHVIGKLVKLHFAANLDAFDRLINLGEEKERVFLTGAPQLDDIFDFDESSGKIINEILELEKNQFVLCVYHGVTEEIDDCLEGLDNLSKVLNSQSKDVIYILPNNDAGGIRIREKIIKNKRPNDSIYSNLERNNYLYLLKYCELIIGNSSSGLLEAPIFKKACVNIGNRQNKRVKGGNVIDCGYKKKDILNALNICRENKKFINDLMHVKSPYGDSPASKKIVDAMIACKNKNKNFLRIRDISY